MLQKGQNTALLNACVGTSNVEIMVSIFMAPLLQIKGHNFRTEEVIKSKIILGLLFMVLDIV